MATNYDKLVADLNHANKAACQAVSQVDDGGSANRDSVFLRIPRARERSVLAAIQKAGLYCRRKSHWIGQGYFITPTSGGQGDKRAKAAEVMAKTLNDLGWDTLTFQQMD
ncbi:hypothetical protein P9G84_22280 [Brevibacillus centrosporus]|uniref:hypothetical protein n=1 Tax=Brevibacillus centrosporus TaxID=54910 RepID=UPI000F0A1D85|nr:hypothetical protein [Brevibacillus centrosporus]MEC2131656.1 hypothetical protein [Brevibacillus centrosporus]RNB63266.1 hypothetical protein EDM55_29205 [Brevibacillus centrosporus]GED34991.1 hypothetical protein BCE02nite_61320 [Brevibacillus centrosporus]